MEDRCKHGMFFSGAGACPQCGGGADPVPIDVVMFYDNSGDQVCAEHGGTFDDNPGKSVCKTCEDWLVLE